MDDNGLVVGRWCPNPTPSQARAHIHRGKKTGHGVKGAQRTWTLTATRFSSQLGPPISQVRMGVSKTAGGGPPWRAGFLSTGPQAQEEAGHSALRRHLPAVCQAPSSARHVEAGALWVRLLQMSLPCTTALLSLRAGCPQTQSSLPPDAKAPAAAPEPGTALAAAGEAWFPEAVEQQWLVGHGPNRDSWKPHSAHLRAPAERARKQRGGDKERQGGESREEW